MINNHGKKNLCRCIFYYKPYVSVQGYCTVVTKTSRIIKSKISYIFNYVFWPCVISNVERLARISALEARQNLLTSHLLGYFAKRRKPLLPASACLAPDHSPPSGGESAPPKKPVFHCSPGDHKAKGVGPWHQGQKSYLEKEHMHNLRKIQSTSTSRDLNLQFSRISNDRVSSSNYFLVRWWACPQGFWTPISQIPLMTKHTSSGSHRITCLCCLKANPANYSPQLAFIQRGFARVISALTMPWPSTFTL